MAAPVARTRSRPFAATAVAALLLFVLSGCVKLNADFHVDAEETLSGSMQILVDPIALEDMGSPDPSRDLDDAVSETEADSDVPDGVTVDRVEDEDGYIGMGVTFDRVPASEFQNGGGGLDDVGVEGIEVDHTDGEISFSMTNPLVAGTDSSDPFGSAGGMPSTARSMFDEAVVSVTFPGTVISAEGAEANGNTATWNLREYDGKTLTATGNASSFPWGIVLIVGGLLLFLLVVAGVIILTLVVRKNQRQGTSNISSPSRYPDSGGWPGASAANAGSVPAHISVPPSPGTYDPVDSNKPSRGGYGAPIASSGRNLPPSHQPPGIGSPHPQYWQGQQPPGSVTQQNQPQPQQPGSQENRRFAPPAPLNGSPLVQPTQDPAGDQDPRQRGWGPGEDG